jgi:5-methyltetrahydropteroyltriglutamate--homocysteine methyltransferase
MAMKTSQDRVLTTHVGSLPRPPELKALLVRKDQGEAYDKAALDRLTRQAVVDIVRRQAQTGIDIVNDGEMSKPGYSPYVADRLSGFAGDAAARHARPRISAAYERMTGVPRRWSASGWRCATATARRPPPICACLAGPVAEGFMTAASPDCP